MDQHESRNFRLYFLGVLLAAVLLVYLGVLYSVQVVHHQDYATQSVHSIARPETVEASRGVITDRNGRLLVGNRSTYNLTFDPSLLKEGEDQNGAILRLIQLCQANGVDWIENLPISRQLPYTYTLDQLGDSVLKRRFLSYLKALDPSREALTAYLLQHPETVAPRSEAGARGGADGGAEGPAAAPAGGGPAGPAGLQALDGPAPHCRRHHPPDAAGVDAGGL